MSEFFLQIGRKSQVDISNIGQDLKHFEDFKVYSLDENNVSIVLTSCENPLFWAPFRSNSGQISVFMAGRIALTEREWQKASEEEGEGGLAGRWVHRLYWKNGIEGLKELNGAYTIIVVDKGKNAVHLVTDRCGMFQCFHYEKNRESLFFSSNADILAKTCGVSMSWDMISLSEFIMSGRVSFPYTYYSTIRSLATGTIFTYRLNEQGGISASHIRYFDFAFEPDATATLDGMAEELAVAIESSVRKRTLPIFGKCAVALSGGLDSRTVLGAIKDRSNVVAVSFFDEENYEFRIAQRIAQKAGVDIIPIKRDFDHYGKTAEKCVKISCGMGDCFDNHYLGFRDNFKQHAIENILTGLYFDYFFKSLALDRKMVPYWGTNYCIEKEDNFRFEHYQSCFTFATKLSSKAEARMLNTFPYHTESILSEKIRLEIARKRTIPLCYTSGNAQAVVSQKVLPWSLPILDTDVLKLYLKVPIALRMNRKLSLKLARVIGGKDMLGIPDANTRTRVDATDFERMLSWYLNSIGAKLRNIIGINKAGIATEESWPDYIYYMKNSEIIKKLWERPNPIAHDLFLQIAGQEYFRKNIVEYNGWRSLFLFIRFFTLKLWMDQMCNQ